GAGERGPRRVASVDPHSVREGPDRGEAERRGQREDVRGYQRLRDDPEGGMVSDRGLARRRRDARRPADGLPRAAQREDERERRDARAEGGSEDLGDPSTR